jgi:hypothetical protein
VGWRWSPFGRGLLLADGCRRGGRQTTASFGEQIEPVEGGARGGPIVQASSVRRQASGRSLAEWWRLADPRGVPSRPEIAVHCTTPDAPDSERSTTLRPADTIGRVRVETPCRIGRVPSCPSPRGPRRDYRPIEPTVSPLAGAPTMLDSQVGADMQRSPRDREALGESKAAMTRFSFQTIDRRRSLGSSRAVVARATASLLRACGAGGWTW